MRLINFFKTKKLLLLNIVLSIYIVTNLIGGERGLVSYYEKKKLDEELVLKKESLIQELSEVEKMNKLLSSKLNLDFIETIYREKLKFGKKEEIIIKLK
tara:strand:+ start:74 stop:370 length:297 start_codon:yes stop_codon:yes gene_type:complete